MNFDLSEEQVVVRDLAEQIIGGTATTDRVKEIEAGDGFDRQLWGELAAANLLGLCLPAEHGGSGMGMVELALIAEQQGRHVAPVPLVPTLVAAMAIAAFGTEQLCTEILPAVGRGALVLTSALAESGANDVTVPTTTAVPDGGSWRVTGTRPAVPFAPHADHILVPASRADGTTVVAVIEAGAPGVTLDTVTTTDRLPHAHVGLDTVVDTDHVLADGGAVAWLAERTLAALCAVQVGVAAHAVALAAQHVSTRQQFGRPLSAFQAVTQRAADAYITTEAMRVTALNAAWRLAAGLDARRDVLVAAYWTSQGGQDVVLAAQHLHGGVGADVDYPLHRYFLWGSQLANSLGTASSHLARLGRLISTSSVP